MKLTHSHFSHPLSRRSPNGTTKQRHHLADPQNEGAKPSPPDPREGSCSRYCEENQVTTPDPLLVAKMTRLALQMLATDTLRPTVTSAAMELVMDSVSLASPKLRRELIDLHRAALDWVLRDAFTSQVPSGRNLPPESEIVIDGDRLLGRSRAEFSAAESSSPQLVRKNPHMAQSPTVIGNQRLRGKSPESRAIQPLPITDNRARYDLRQNPAYRPAHLHFTGYSFDEKAQKSAAWKTRRRFH